MGFPVARIAKKEPRLRIESRGEGQTGGRVLLDGVDVSDTVAEVTVHMRPQELPVAFVTFLNIDVDTEAVDSRDLDNEPTDA
jgi:hypothetical protein